jgi:hypothetical protein
MPAQRFVVSRPGSERGVALITTLMIMALMSALMIGFTTAVTSDQRYRVIDRDRVRAFYAAQSGIEQLNVGLANLFFANVAPNAAQIGAIGDAVPVIPDVTFTADTAATYGVQLVAEPPPEPISTGPYQGLIALKKVYELNATARTVGGGEAHLRRRVETVAIPVFQFGMFSEVDLSFSAADDFDFGGRVHTNGNLFLAQGGASGSTLWLRDKVTAVGEIVRQYLSNGQPISASGSTRTVRMAKAPGTLLDMPTSHQSVNTTLTSGENPSWPTISLSTYNGFIRDGTTGARALNLPLITNGGSPIDIIRRPAANENVANATLFGERFFSQVSLRILLSDTANDITSLPTVTAAPPISLEDWNTNLPAGYGPIDATHSPVARSPGPPTAGRPTVRFQVTGSTSGDGSHVQVSGNEAIRVGAGIPDEYQITNPLTLTDALGIPLGSVTCTRKTATAFEDCTGIVAALQGSIVSSAVTATDGVVPVSTVTTAPVLVTDTTLPVESTLAFSPNTFWVEGTNNLATCSGYNTVGSQPNRFTGCNVSQQINNNSWMTASAALSDEGTGTIGGFIKIERQGPAGTWTDVTMEILNYGISGTNLAGKSCGTDATLFPNAILRLQRLRDNNEHASGHPPVNGACSYAGTERSTDFWPNVLYDAREGVFRDSAVGGAPNNIRLGGVMHYVALDVANLSQWFAGTGAFAAGTGNQSLSINGYAVYFSDRRNNRNESSLETGEYGFEDVVNPASSVGTPNGTLQTGEDLNGNGVLETYGQFPSYNGTYNTVPPGAAAPLDATARPTTNVSGGVAKVNRALLFRRALKLVNGSLGQIVAPGLTVASENPVYVQGDWNANQGGFGDPHVATSVIADAVTLLSNDWNDTLSFSSPYVNDGRPRDADTWYRLAIISGKGPLFPRPGNGEGATYGTDGGAHSFLRMLEGTSGTVHYLGSMATFYYNRQAVAPFKCCGGVVYDVPVRDFTFDTDFLNPALLPPLTPVFRDINALGFTQETRPGM